MNKRLDIRESLRDKKDPNHQDTSDRNATNGDWDNHLRNSQSQGFDPYTTPYDSVPLKPQSSQQYPYPEPDNSYPTGTPGASADSNLTIPPIDHTKKETLDEECLRLIAEIVIDRNTSYGACKDQFEKDIGPSFKIIFNKISTRPSKDVEKDWVGVFDYPNKYQTIVDFLKKASYYAKHKLGGIHGIEGWGSFLNFLRNGNQMNDLAKARLTTMQRMNLPGTEVYAGNVTEQQAAVQSYKLALLYY
jgi:hypothetical protein